MGELFSTPAVSAVSISGLTKRYGTSVALDSVSFDVGAGCIFGLLGPNGAGKTTTLECILGLRQPDAGAIRVHGCDVSRQAAEVKRQVGALLQAASLQDRLTPRQALELFGSFYRDPYPAGELLDRFALADKADATFASLSGGQRQRLFLALALVNRPALLVLDEPTAGLDPQARGQLRGLIRSLRSEGRTVLLSTHDLEEAEGLCDVVAVMDRGRLVASAPPAELIAHAQAPARVLVRTEPGLSRDVVAALPGVEAASESERGWLLETRAPETLLVEVIRRADQAGVRLADVGLRRPTLEDAFLELTGHAWSGAGSEPRP